MSLSYRISGHGREYVQCNLLNASVCHTYLLASKSLGRKIFYLRLFHWSSVLFYYNTNGSFWGTKKFSKGKKIVWIISILPFQQYFFFLTSVIIMTFSIKRRKFNYFRQVSHETIHHEKVADATLGLAFWPPAFLTLIVDFCYK